MLAGLTIDISILLEWRPQILASFSLIATLLFAVPAGAQNQTHAITAGGRKPLVETRPPTRQ